jgi:hypothetical protein
MTQRLFPPLSNFLSQKAMAGAADFFRQDWRAATVRPAATDALPRIVSLPASLNEAGRQRLLRTSGKRMDETCLHRDPSLGIVRVRISS